MHATYRRIKARKKTERGITRLVPQSDCKWIMIRLPVVADRRVGAASI